MKLYNSLVRRNKKGEIQDVLLIEEGFSFLAFLFSGFWFFYHKMWKEAFFLIAINIIFALIFNGFEQKIFEIIFIFLVAVNAKYWLNEHLKKKGYEFLGLTLGSNLTNARLKFITNLEDKNDFDQSIFSLKKYN